MCRLFLLSVATVATVFSTAPAWAASGSTEARSYASATTPASLAQFTPRPSKRTSIDYAVWDEMLKSMVLYSGTSLRQLATRPKPNTGTRRVYGHTSPYRLEGNRVVMEGFNDEFSEALDLYVEDLVRVGNQVDIPALRRNEQLAYWFNLHNALVIQAIKDAYPISRTNRIKGPNGEPFHDTKRVTIKGTPLSLRDIREGIVYPNWQSPMVIYGFFHGDISSPSIQSAAFKGANVSDVLNFAGQEFATSLRGFRVDRNRASVSQIYRDAAPWFFPDFETDVRDHLADLLTPELRRELAGTEQGLRISNYETDLADMTRGDVDPPDYGQLRQEGTDGFSINSGPLARARAEFREKYQRQRARGQTGTVIIEDIETTDEGRPSEIE